MGGGNREEGLAAPLSSDLEAVPCATDAVNASSPQAKINFKRDAEGEYDAVAGGVRFHIWRATDAGFGLTAYRISDNKQLHSGPSIMWLRTKRRCVERAQIILEREQCAEGRS